MIDGVDTVGETVTGPFAGAFKRGNETGLTYDLKMAACQFNLNK